MTEEDPLWNPDAARNCVWHPYPPDVAMKARRECAFPGCGRPGELVRVCAPSAWVNNPLPYGNQATLVTVWCRDDAAQQGFDGSLAEDEPPPTPETDGNRHWHLFRRWFNETHGPDSEPGNG